MTGRADLRIDTDSIVLPGSPGATEQLLVLHHAGGSALSLLPVMRALPETVEVRLLELPGRGVRSAEPPAPTFADALEDILPRVSARLDRPSILLGHSLGGLLADAVAHRLGAPQRALVRAVVVAASPPPVPLPSSHVPVVPRNRERLEQDLLAFGGTPIEVLQDPALRDHVLRLLGQDMILVDSYLPPPCLVPPSNVAPIEYHVWSGADDRTLAAVPTGAWISAGRSPVRSRIFAGGHFFMMNAEAEAMSALSALLDAEARGRPADVLQALAVAEQDEDEVDR